MEQLLVSQPGGTYIPFAYESVPLSETDKEWFVATCICSLCSEIILGCCFVAYSISMVVHTSLLISFDYNIVLACI